MTHYVAIVIGDDIEGQLAPYDEGIDVAPHWAVHTKNVPESDGARRMLGVEPGVEITAEQFVAYVMDRYDDEKLRVSEDGKDAEHLTTYNPQSKWDWYAIGGRWAGRLITKDGARVDSALKREIDFDAMVAAAKKAAGDDWDEMDRHFGGLRGDQKVSEWYRKQYHLDRLDPRGSYVEEESRYPLGGYALVKDGQWHAQGEMGWWGMSDDAMTTDEWQARLWESITELPEDARITVVDLHI